MDLDRFADPMVIAALVAVGTVVLLTSEMIIAYYETIPVANALMDGALASGVSSALGDEKPPMALQALTATLRQSAAATGAARTGSEYLAIALLVCTAAVAATFVARIRLPASRRNVIIFGVVVAVVIGVINDVPCLLSGEQACESRPAPPAYDYKTLALESPLCKDFGPAIDEVPPFSRAAMRNAIVEKFTTKPGRHFDEKAIRKRLRERMVPSYEMPAAIAAVTRSLENGVSSIKDAVDVYVEN